MDRWGKLEGKVTAFAFEAHQRGEGSEACEAERGWSRRLEGETKGATVTVFSIWESYFPAEVVSEGRQATEAIWRDMTSFDGYLSHELVEDLDDPGHLFVLSQWRSQEDADAALREYKGNENAERADSLVAKARRRTLGRAL
jgi:heme-degrading monooxygenase HmoA